ncbi:hypothetical protein PQ459_07055 [Chryseobacterium sp. KACC 21268]|nr:hypothetical protein PQ459_07055 [Chryseobacterium sp. KACC 21268]
MNLKQKISIGGFSNIFCCLALYMVVFCTFVYFVFNFDRGRNRLCNRLFGISASKEHFQFPSVSRRSLSLLFSTAFLFTSFFNGQTSVPNDESVLHITEGTMVYGGTSIYVDEKPEISHSAKKEVVENRTSKDDKKNVIKDAVEKKKVALELPKGNFDEIIYRKDLKSNSFFLNSTFKFNSCAIVCASSLHNFIGENFIAYNDFQTSKEVQYCNLKIEFLSSAAFFLSEHFSYQFFGTSPPFSLG